MKSPQCRASVLHGAKFKKDLQDKLFEQVMEKESGGGGKLITCYSSSVRPSIRSFVHLQNPIGSKF